MNTDMKMNQEKSVKDRETTEKKLLDAVGEIINESGLEKLGVNAIAKKAGVSKMLIYRYFGSIEELVAQYILKKDYWINISTEAPPLNELGNFIKNMFQEQIIQMRNDKLLIRLYRWELSSNNHIVEELRKKRESNGIQLVELVSSLTNKPINEVKVIASLLTASISYLTMLEDVCPVYIGINLQEDKGWQQISEGIDALIDNWIANIEK
ncbi:MAG: TetR/AcrR family transcriptional regulator [Flavobacteriaceae bacterium]|jgi:AcrR family transcriptional regulator|nr:TetR/AcrR family transcriptional regulator [Flavobacteriaceae bacterium]